MPQDVETKDRRLLTVIDAAVAESVRRSGSWIACRPGCTECCMGPFAITALDALRLRKGLSELETTDPDRAARVRRRAEDYVARIAPGFPGDVSTGKLLDQDVLPESADDLPCPALDPDTGLCDLYASRPITCRVFGPAVRWKEGNVGTCELCYIGASDEQKIQCAVEVDPDGLEMELLGAPEDTFTLVGFALVGN